MKKFPAQLKQFGSIVKSLREEDSLTQPELAKKSNIDIRTIQRIESGDMAVGLHILFALAKAFNMAPYELLLKIECTWIK